MKTGWFDQSYEVYAKEHGVRQSDLKLLARSPAHMRYALDNPEPSTLDQDIGNVFDIAVFQPDKLSESCAIRPSKYPATEKNVTVMRDWHSGATYCKEWLAKAKMYSLPIIPHDRYENILRMRDAVLKFPAAAFLLKQGKSGLSLYCEDSETGLQLKARPDWMTGSVIPDLKSTNDASPQAFSKTIANFGYDIQAAFYLDIANTLALKKDCFAFIVCEKDPPFAVAVYQIFPEDVEIGRQKYRRLLNRYLECVCANSWPGYSTDIQFIGLPAWAKHAEVNAMLLGDRPAALELP